MEQIKKEFLTDIVKESFNNIGNGIKEERYLIFSRSIWEQKDMNSMGYDFTKEELDSAEKAELKLIGVKMGVKCYLSCNFK